MSDRLLGGIMVAWIFAALLILAWWATSEITLQHELGRQQAIYNLHAIEGRSKIVWQWTNEENANRNMTPRVVDSGWKGDEE